LNSSVMERQNISSIDMYDVSMSVKPAIHRRKRWDLWGGLYYAGTIYTTIGYGDLVAVTFWGRLFTMVYAVLGIPMVITILNDWGTIMFIVANSESHPGSWRRASFDNSYSFQSICETPTPPAKPEPLAGDPDEAEPIPLILVAVVLLFWLAVCCSVFVYFEKWTYFETIYFFFISLTTIGFGDVTPSHRVAVANFLLILVGLSVVSMAINVVQMQLEIVFAKVVQSIDNDFKMNLSVSGEFVSFQQISQTCHYSEQDVVKQYGEGMSGGERFLMRFMSHHQRKMLNEKFEERSRMRNKWTQTATQIKVASVQTGKFVEPVIPEEELDEDSQPKSGIASKRLYIYNTGE
uniref:Ion_trans_2 domain-containing protein n=1 Tax=Heligmosomoides polygyrus TaxID=6339 RepID=A0A8L8K680_HELPZ